MYAFAAFDPVNGWDPWGLECKGFSSSAECIAAGAAEFYDDIGKQLEEEIQFCQNNPGACDVDAEDVARELINGLLDTAAKGAERYGDCLIENFGNTVVCSLPVDVGELTRLWLRRRFRSIGKQIGSLILETILSAAGAKGVSYVDGAIKIKRSTSSGFKNQNSKSQNHNNNKRTDLTESSKNKDVKSKKNKDCESCFSPKTPVSMCDGSFKAIGDVKEDDLVLSRDEFTGELGCNHIVEIHTDLVQGYYNLTLYEQSTGKVELFEVTGSHPFITLQDGQVRAEHLNKDHVVLGDKSGQGFILVSKVFKPKPLHVINLGVENHSTYFVGHRRV